MNKRKMIVGGIIACVGIVLLIIGGIQYGFTLQSPSVEANIVGGVAGLSVGSGLAIIAIEWIKGDKSYKK